MNKLFDFASNLELWVINKDRYFAAAACNTDYVYEVIKETDKAICTQIFSTKKHISNWTKWIPKSAIIK